MDSLTLYSYLKVFFIGSSFVISIIALVCSKKTSSASIELGIQSSLASSKHRVEDLTVPISKLCAKMKKSALDEIESAELESYKKIFSAALESTLNAYEEACAKYIDSKVDKKRFKKTYVSEIRNIFVDENYSLFLNPVSSKYRAIKKVHEEWENLER